ncbi:tetratricopeptide repeat protein [Methanobacterium sp.]|uniref:tetratricopeptide repeat protein n=1 Tax=Methanobacterium sp. TaxID=2164 RepID=UPI003C78AAD8
MWNIFQSIGSITKVKGKGSLKYYKKRLKEYQENEADVLIDIGVLCLEEEKFDESLEYLENARQIYYNLNEKEAEAFVLDLIGDVYLSTREMDKALMEYQKSFRIYSSIKSSMKNEMFEKIKEVENIKEAIELASEEKINAEIEEESNYDEMDEEYVDDTFDEEEYVEDTKYICSLNYEKIALKIEKLMNILKKRYNIKKYLENEYEITYIRKSLIEAHKNLENEKEAVLFLIMGNFFMKEEKTYSAMQNFKDAFNIFYEVGDNEGKAFSLLLLGVTYYLLGKEDKIYSIFKETINIFEDLKDAEGKSVAIDLINTLYSEDICLNKEHDNAVTT